MPLADVVLNELQTLRRQSVGVTVETIARAPVICRLLGDGDPYLAYSRLQHGLLDAAADRTIQAAAASLGFSTTGDTHLRRLDQAGLDLGLDQRQVRRLSDQGLSSLAALIATNWTVEAVPMLTVDVTVDQSRYTVILSTRRPLAVEMSEPDVETLVADRQSTPPMEWILFDKDESAHAVGDPLFITRTDAETSLTVVWRGELWPKFNVRWRGDISDVTSESLGNKLMLRLVARQR